MIQILSGQVKYKDRNDYLVEYTNLGDRQYYITNKLNNGNFVTTTVLKEAIHEEMNPTSFGLINSEGESIIDCNNRSINPSGENYLVVESVNPENETVKEMAALQNDPLNANKIVSLRAELKESLTNAMNGDNGKLEFANPCSEATVCDINGQNIVNNEKYSYIGRGDSGFYLRKVDSPAIVKYDFATNSLSNIGEEQVVSPMDAPLTPQVPIVEDAAVEQVTEQPVEATEEVAPEEIEQEVSEAPVEEVAEQPIEAPVEVAPQSLDTTEEVVSEGAEQEIGEVPAEEVVEQPVEAIEGTVAEEVAPEEIEQEVGESPVEEVVEQPVEATEEVAPEETVEQEVSEVPTEEVVTDQVETTEEVAPEAEEVVADENTDLNIANVKVDKEEIENVINDSDAGEEIENDEFKVDLDNYENKHHYTDSRLEAEDVRTAFKRAEEKAEELLPDFLRKTKEVVAENRQLVAENKKQKNEIQDLKETVKDANELTRALKGKVVEYKDEVSDLERQNDHLNRINDKMNQKISEQQEIIEKQQEENNDWKYKFQRSTERYDRIQDEFKKILNNDSYDSYDYEDDFSKRMVA